VGEVFAPGTEPESPPTTLLTTGRMSAFNTVVQCAHNNKQSTRIYSKNIWIHITTLLLLPQ